MTAKSLFNILSLTLLFTCAQAGAQGSLARGNKVPDLPVKTVLNYAGQNAKMLSDLQSDITIIDFFGTWCAPCIGALPKLASIKKIHAPLVSVVLVSVETEKQLQNFIAKRSDFLFPVVVDTDNRFITVFQPPSYPYTIVLNKRGYVLDITTAEAITDQKINDWLQHNDTLPMQTNNITSPQAKLKTAPLNGKSSNALVNLSQQYIYAAKTGENITALEDQLEDIEPSALLGMLRNDDDKKAFWINLYNGYTQHALAANPLLYKNRNSFFTKEGLNVAGKMFSPDDIEHGILRRSKIKWSLGYINKLFAGKLEKKLRVDTLDYRIHFALNCGAKSCPPIAFYSNENLNAQLDLAAAAYLASEVIYDSASNTAEVPRLMSWFRGDFEGKRGIRRILKKQGLIPQSSKPKIKFKPYDWNLYLNNYKQ